MGVPTLGCSVELRRSAGPGPVPDGEVAEVVVGGTQGVHLFDGYLDDPATTAAAFDGGWFRTGDLASRDADGRFYFAGRSGDVMKVAGENVSTVEVEEVLSAHAGVLEAAVIALPDPIRDEVPVAFVVRSPGVAPVTESDLASYCESRLAPSKRPRAMYFLDELPRTSVGKVRKFVLKSDAAVRARQEGGV
jgi:crotonobetaine/carnitine-CoA ligase